MTLLDSYLPVFKHVLQMTGDPVSFNDYEQSRRDCISLLDQAVHNAGMVDIAEEEKSAALVAVIAWLDETILRSTLPWRSRWQSELLQRKYLNITVAGELFFKELAKLEPTHRQVRKVFLFCLQRDFHGQYNTPGDRPALQALIAEQLQLCLPEEWLIWPSDAAITPQPFTAARPVARQSHPQLIGILCVVMLYAALFIFLSKYMT